MRRRLFETVLVIGSVKACFHMQVVLQDKIERLIVVSSASVTRPYAPVGILLNTLGAKMSAWMLSVRKEQHK